MEFVSTPDETDATSPSCLSTSPPHDTLPACEHEGTRGDRGDTASDLRGATASIVGTTQQLQGDHWDGTAKSAMALSILRGQSKASEDNALTPAHLRSDNDPQPQHEGRRDKVINIQGKAPSNPVNGTTPGPTSHSSRVDDDSDQQRDVATTRHYHALHKQGNYDNTRHTRDKKCLLTQSNDLVINLVRVENAAIDAIVLSLLV